ncbi:ArnT family glycosyltransferase [Phosphitispora fastidiosa]|uniref:ArnT family glycosyltransferase n=1 Tax=Phosphitispora fastidiosa TaxID=2837202 RepID=UPI001E513FAC|nr:glycosyltransferase family 39 protein [Phosphitispora fastidiosa]MBU7005325.1 4-amino-4-deoxy-L-arabinose transferase-like glycosyltransferase [Phosphitispora fastidiosa]
MKSYNQNILKSSGKVYQGSSAPRWSARELALLGLILLLALGLRFYFLLGIEQPGPFSDGQNYNLMVRQLLDKKIYGYHSESPNTYVTPGFPMFLALVYIVHGYSPDSPVTAVRIYQALMMTAAAGLVHLLARRICSKPGAMTAALVAAVYPPLIWSTSAFLTESLFTFLFLAYIYTIILALDQDSMAATGISGIFFGAAVLTKPQLAPFFFVPFVLARFQQKTRNTLKMFLVFSVFFILLMTPWWIRNYLTFHQLILTATQTGNPLLAGTDPYYRLGVEKLFAGVNPEDQTTHALNRIVSGFKNETLLYLKWFTIEKFSIMFREPWLRFTGNFLLGLKIIHLPVVILGWVGLLAGLRKPPLKVLAAAVIMLTLIQLVFLPLPRYVFPLMPLLIISSVHLIEQIWETVRFIQVNY